MPSQTLITYINCMATKYIYASQSTDRLRSAVSQVINNLQLCCKVLKKEADKRNEVNRKINKMVKK